MHNRFSNASLSSITTLLPQYTHSIHDISEDAESPDTALTVDTAYGLPAYALSRSDSGQSSSLSLAAPPRYSMVHLPQSSSGSDSTGSTLGDPPHQFQYSYPIRSKKPWATLHLSTQNAIQGNPKPLKSRPGVPRFWSCDPVVGSLELNLESPQNIQQISISINGSVVMTSVSEVKFLDHEIILWDKPMGVPHSNPNPTYIKRYDGRFTPGKYIFPFSFPFPSYPNKMMKSLPPDVSLISPFDHAQRPTPSPREQIHRKEKEALRPSNLTSPGVSPKAKAKSQTDLSSPQMETPTRSPSSTVSPVAHQGLASPLPQSFLEKGINPNVSYGISVRIAHGRFRGASRIETSIVYIPSLHPHPLPQRRREAYEAAVLLPCPMNNPEEWFTCPTFNVYGGVKAEGRLRNAKVECTLSLAQPLSYTRGSVIPCFLTFSSDDEDAVHLLSDVKSPNMRLVRRIWHPMDEDRATSSERTVNFGDPDIGSWKTWKPHNSTAPSEMKLVKHDVGRARWWPRPKGVVQAPNVRHLEGEIHLNNYLQPSCDFLYFQVEYAVELLAFQAANFVLDIYPSSDMSKPYKRDTVLASKSVEIMTLHRQDNPIPTVYSEPPKTGVMRFINLSEEDDESGLRLYANLGFF